MQPRSAVPLLALVLAASCGSPVTGPTGPNAPKPGPGAPSLQAQSAGAFECTDLLYDATLQDVVVPAGASCIIAYSRLSGTLTVMPGGSVYAVENQIAGAADFDNPASVELVGGEITGNLVIDGDRRGDATAPYYRIAAVTVTQGDIVVTGNAGVQVNVRGNRVLAGSIRVQTNIDSFLSVIANQVARDVHVVGNIGVGSNVVRTNTAGGSIRCDGNTPAPVVGFNQAPKVQGQCFVAQEPEF